MGPVAIKQDEESCARKYATAKAMDKLWKAVESREDIPAELLGVARYFEDGNQVAFVRDVQDRVMVVNAFLLAFGLWAVHPDALTMAAAPIEASCLRPGQTPWFDTPLALRRGGELVGLLTPMRLTVDEYPTWDFGGDPIPLAEVFADRDMTPAKG